MARKKGLSAEDGHGNTDKNSIVLLSVADTTHAGAASRHDRTRTFSNANAAAAMSAPHALATSALCVDN
jgi:hypothetical protein